MTLLLEHGAFSALDFFAGALSGLLLLPMVPLLLVPAIYGDPPHAAAIDFFLAAVAFPILVWVGATIEPSRCFLFSQLGSLSYAIYAVHQPLFTLVWRAILLVGRNPETLAPTIGVLFCGAVVALCFALDRYYDAPVRRLLTKTIRRERGKTAGFIDSFNLSTQSKIEIEHRARGQENQVGPVLLRRSNHRGGECILGRITERGVDLCVCLGTCRGDDVAVR